MEGILNEILQWKEQRKTGYNLAVKTWLAWNDNDMGLIKYSDSDCL